MKTRHDPEQNAPAPLDAAGGTATERISSMTDDILPRDDDRTDNVDRTLEERQHAAHAVDAELVLERRLRELWENHSMASRIDSRELPSAEFEHFCEELKMETDAFVKGMRRLRKLRSTRGTS